MSLGVLLCASRRRAEVVTGGSTYRYFRLYIVDINGGVEAQCDELKIFAGATDYPTSAMTADNAPSPLVASASVGPNPYKCFDNTVPDSHWSADSTSANAWVKIDLGAGNEFTPTSFKFTCTSVTSRAPKNFRLEGSNTGAFSGEETILKTAGPETGWSANEERTFTI